MAIRIASGVTPGRGLYAAIVGGFIRNLPFPVTVGFTAGNAVVIFASQLMELLGLSLAAPEPIVPKLEALSGTHPTANFAAVLVAMGTIAVILVVRRWRPL